MKAIMTTRYGPADALQLQDVPKPVPGDNEILIKVHAASVTSGDVFLRRVRFPLSLVLSLLGFKRKPIPGHELAGEVEAVGKAVTRFKPGDAVFGTTTGLSAGANAEYVVLPETWDGGTLAIKPADIPYTDAAAVPVGGMTALYLLRKAGIRSGQKVLIYGASGSVGTFAVQLARYYGAEVTGVASTANVELVQSLGAAHVIDYKREDFTAGGAQYDLIFDAVGKISKSEAKPVLAPGGSFVSVKGSMVKGGQENLLLLKDLIEAGEIKPVIDRTYPLAQTAEAHRYVESGRKRGNVVITVNGAGA